MKLILTTVLFIFAVFQLFGGERDSKDESPLSFDRLVNTSRLGDAELRTLFENLDESRAAELLDLDGDGLADFTGIDVWEFIARMKIIMSDKRPFVYRRDAHGNRIKHRDAVEQLIQTNEI